MSVLTPFVGVFSSLKSVLDKRHGCLEAFHPLLVPLRLYLPSHLRGCYSSFVKDTATRGSRDSALAIWPSMLPSDIPLICAQKYCITTLSRQELQLATKCLTCGRIFTNSRGGMAHISSRCGSSKSIAARKALLQHGLLGSQVYRRVLANASNAFPIYREVLGTTVSRQAPVLQLTSMAASGGTTGSQNPLDSLSLGSLLESMSHQSGDTGLQTKLSGLSGKLDFDNKYVFPFGVSDMAYRQMLTSATLWSIEELKDASGM